MSAAEITDLLVLAAIDRAVRHGRQDEHATTKPAILRHLDVRPRSGRSRRVSAALDVLAERGLVEPIRQQGRNMWKLTGHGRRQLSRARASGKLPGLPEAPQHRVWRESRTLAEERLERFRCELSEALREGLALLQASCPAQSRAWDALGKRLGQDCANVASAMYCLGEWEEPSDDQADRGDTGNWHLRRDVRN